MLTAEWVRVHCREGELTISALTGKPRERATAIAQELLAVVRDGVGCARDQILSDFDSVETGVRERRIKGGLIKLIEDRCTWGTEAATNPEALRRALFRRSTEVRRSSSPREPWERQAVVGEVATQLGIAPAAVDGTLYADLSAAQRLRAVEPITPAGLVEAYEMGQAQAVLLRALRIEVVIRCASAAASRALFRRLKFLQLLYTIDPCDDGYRLVIDGPMSLFESSTRYGQKIAFVLPVLEECGQWELEAQVEWTRGAPPVRFRCSGKGARGGGETTPDLSDPVATLVRNFERLETEWKVSPAVAVLTLPGVGLCIPDLVFEKGDHRVFLEVMGFWSRDSVFRRIDLVRRGLDVKILFAVSRRLRVSEALLEDHPCAALYVYRDVLSARTIAERLDGLIEPMG